MSGPGEVRQTAFQVEGVAPEDTMGKKSMLDEEQKSQNKATYKQNGEPGGWADRCG